MVTLLFGVNLVLIQGVNRPTRGRCAFSGSFIMLAINSAICGAFLYLFIDIVYLQDCSAPFYGPPKGAAIAVNDCPAYGTRCGSCAGHGEPMYDASVSDFYPGISCACDPGWGPAKYILGVRPCSVRTDLNVTSTADLCTDCNFCGGSPWGGSGLAAYASVSNTCSCTCAWGVALTNIYGGEACPTKPAAVGLGQVLFAFLDPDAQSHQLDAVLKQYQALIVVIGFISLAAFISIMMYLRLVMYHIGFVSTRKGGVFPVTVFSDKHRETMREAALASFGPRRTCLPRPSLEPLASFADESILKRFWVVFVSPWRYAIDAISERGAFVYPLPVIVCAFVTPVVLVYSCVYIYFMCVSPLTFLSLTNTVVNGRKVIRSSLNLHFYIFFYTICIRRN
jgi:hypothetical protein